MHISSTSLKASLIQKHILRQQASSDSSDKIRRENQLWGILGENSRSIEEGKEIKGELPLLLSERTHSLHCCWTLGTELITSEAGTGCHGYLLPPYRSNLWSTLPLRLTGILVFHFSSRVACNASATKTLNTEALCRSIEGYRYITAISQWSVPHKCFSELFTRLDAILQPQLIPSACACNYPSSCLKLFKASWDWRFSQQYPG